MANLRVTTHPLEIGGRKLDAGERLTLICAGANKDEAMFGDPDRLELRLLLEALLACTDPGQLPVSRRRRECTIVPGGSLCHACSVEHLGSGHRFDHGQKPGQANRVVAGGGLRVFRIYAA